MGSALIDSLARHQPDDTAVEAGEQRTSYGQLLDLACAIREQFTQSPVGQGPIVIADDPGAGACATIAAAQALGRAYVPLSASHPATRIQQMLAAVEPAVIVQSDRTATRMARPVRPLPSLDNITPAGQAVVDPVAGARSQLRLSD